MLMVWPLGLPFSRRAKGAAQAPGVLQKPARTLPTPSGPSTFAERPTSDTFDRIIQKHAQAVDSILLEDASGGHR